MLKEIIGIIIIIIIICVSSHLLQSYLEKTSDEILAKLNKLKEEIKQAKDSDDNTIAKEKSKEIINKWEEINEIWSTLIMHQELDNIKLSILTLNASIETGAYEDALEEIDKSIFLAWHIKEKEMFGLKNIF